MSCSCWIALLYLLGCAPCVCLEGEERRAGVPVGQSPAVSLRCSNAYEWGEIVGDFMFENSTLAAPFLSSTVGAIALMPVKSYMRNMGLFGVGAVTGHLGGYASNKSRFGSYTIPTSLTLVCAGLVFNDKFFVLWPAVGIGLGGFCSTEHGKFFGKNVGDFMKGANDVIKIRLSKRKS